MRYKLIETAKIWPAITINLNCDNVHETPCKTLHEQRCSQVPISFALRQYGAHLSIQCVSNTGISYTFRHAYSNFQFRRVNCYFFGDGWLAGAALFDRISRLITICDIIFHRRLIAIKKRKRRLNRMNRIAPFLVRFTTLLSSTVSALILHPRQIQVLWSQSYDTGSYIHCTR